MLFGRFGGGFGAPLPVLSSGGTRGSVLPRLRQAAGCLLEAPNAAPLPPADPFIAGGGPRPLPPGGAPGRPLSNRLASRKGRDGRGLSRRRPETRPAGGPEVPAGRTGARR